MGSRAGRAGGRERPTNRGPQQRGRGGRALWPPAHCAVLAAPRRRGQFRASSPARSRFSFQDARRAGTRKACCSCSCRTDNCCFQRQLSVSSRILQDQPRPLSQIAGQKVDSLRVSPACLFPCSRAGIQSGTRKARARMTRTATAGLRRCQIRTVSEAPAGATASPFELPILRICQLLPSRGTRRRLPSPGTRTLSPPCVPVPVGCSRPLRSWLRVGRRSHSAVRSRSR